MLNGLEIIEISRLFILLIRNCLRFVQLLCNFVFTGEFHFRRKYALDLVLCVENVRIVEVRVDVRRAWRSRA